MQTKRKPTPTPDACCAGLTAFLDARLFRALCDPTRIALLARLAATCRAATVGEAAAGVPVDLSVVSRHLAVLRDAGILAAEKCGREVRYAVRYPELVKTLRGLADALEACCAPPPLPKEKPRERKR
jgi:DNA-binding transcriptional ArsR family regulator